MTWLVFICQDVLVDLTPFEIAKYDTWMSLIHQRIHNNIRNFSKFLVVNVDVDTSL